MSGREATRSSTVLVLGGYAESLLNFRGPLLSALVGAGHRVIAAAPEDDARVVAGLSALGITYRQVPLSRTGLNPLRDLRSLRALRRLVREERPDVVLAYTIKPVIYGLIAARLVGVRRRHALITGLGYAFTGDGVRQRLVRWVACRLYRLALAGAETVFFQNPDDLACFRALGLVQARQAALVAGSGVDLAQFSPAPPVTGPIRFLLIARLLADKGIREFIAAARLVRARYPQAGFQLVGPRDPNPAAISDVEIADWQREGIVDYRGACADVRPFIAEASVYVLPSYREGTPRTVLEAMAMARPIITTDAPGCRETVREGVNGFLVPVADAQALAQAMIRFIVDPSLITTMGAQSRAMAEERFDVHLVNRVMLERMGLSAEAAAMVEVPRHCSGVSG